MANPNAPSSPESTASSTTQTAEQLVQTVNQATSTATQIANSAAQTAQSPESIRSTVSQSLNTVTQATGITRTLAGTSSAIRETTNTVEQLTQRVQQAEQLLRQVQQATTHTQDHATRDSNSTTLYDSSNVVSSSPLAHVRYRFVPESGELNWRVVHVHIQQAISEPYLIEVELANEDLSAQWSALRHHNASLHLLREEHEQVLHGWVVAVAEAGRQAGHQLCRVWVVSALSMLDQRINSKVFQDLTALEIAEEVWGRGLKQYGRLLRIEVGRDLLPREYCIQYQESDLRFVQRLLAEEGISFYFNHSGDHETIVCVDSHQAFQRAHLMEDAPVEIIGPEAHTAERESIRTFHLREETRIARTVTRDYDYTQPNLNLTHTSGDQQGAALLEDFEYPAFLTYAGTQDHHYSDHDGVELTVIRHETHTQHSSTAQGEGNIIGFIAGGVFELHGHTDEACNRRYLITRIEHWGAAEEELTRDTNTHGSSRTRYHNQFHVIPADTVFRPKRLPKPCISGFLSAVVVGPEGQEISTDFMGRVKVQFHWDREGQHNERSSCFVRVTQAWSGGGWGWVFTPRIGMEVMVAFEAGNPDRPVVTGTLYNGTHALPLDLPAKATQSTIRTSSSPGGQGYNELRFEDAAGSEEIFVHAQKDYTAVIENNRSHTTHGSETNHVDGEHSESVGGNQTLSVSKNRNKTIQGAETIEVQQSRTAHVHALEQLRVDGDQILMVEGRQRTSVQGSRHVDVTGDAFHSHEANRKTTISGNDALAIHGNKTTQIDHTYAITANDQFLVTQSAGTLTMAQNQAVLHCPGGITLTTGQGSISIDAAGKITIAGTEIVLTAGGCSQTMRSRSVKISGAREVSLNVASSSVELSASEAKVGAPKISVAAVGQNEISGGLVKIN